MPSAEFSLSEAVGDAVRDWGPHDPDEAGEMVTRLGTHNRAKALVSAVAAANPPELRLANSRSEIKERSRLLDEDEVSAAVEKLVGKKNIERILSARVRGDGTDPADLVLVVLYELPSTRTARCVLKYENLTKSIKLYESGVKSGAVLGREPRSREELEDTIAKLQKELAASDGKGKPAAEKTEADLTEGTVDDVTGRLPDLSDDELDTLADAEADGDARQGVADAIEEERRLRDLVAGNVGEVKKSLSDLSDGDLADLHATETAREGRKGVLDAVDAEQKRRAS